MSVPEGYCLGFDVSNYNGSLADELAANPGVEVVVVRLGLSCEPPSLRDIARAQIAEAREAGPVVLPYVWCYGSFPPEQTVREAVEWWQEVTGALPRVLWLDCETYERGGAIVDAGPDLRWLHAAEAEAARLGARVGIYTAAWWWTHYVGDSAEFAHLALWDAFYDYDPDLDWGANAYGGWQRPAMQQYSGSPLDLDIVERALLGEREDPQVIAELQQQVASLTADVDDLKSKLGVASVDYVAALRAAAKLRLKRAVVREVGNVANALEALKPPT